MNIVHDYLRVVIGKALKSYETAKSFNQIYWKLVFAIERLAHFACDMGTMSSVVPSVRSMRNELVLYCPASQ